MKRINSICLFLLIFCSLTFQSFAQNSLKKTDIVTKEFWLKMPIPDFSECKMIISLEGIDLPKESCTYVYTLYEKETMYDLKKVKIISLEKKKNWTKIKLKEKYEDAVIIYLKEISKENLIKLFNTIFSRTEIEKPFASNCEKGMSKFELFKCWGFPSSIGNNGDFETYQYGLEFGGIIYGFDMATVEVKNGKITSIGGIV